MPPVTPAAHDVSVLTLNDSYVATLASHCNDALEPSSLLITEGAGDEAAADDWDIDASLLKNENDDDDDADNDYDDDDTAVNDNDDSNVTDGSITDGSIAKLSFITAGTAQTATTPLFSTRTRLRSVLQLYHHNDRGLHVTVAKRFLFVLPVLESDDCRRLLQWYLQQYT